MTHERNIIHIEIIVKRNKPSLGTIGLIVAPWKFDVLKTSIFALEASLLGQIFVFRTSNFRRATISRYFLYRNTLLFK